MICWEYLKNNFFIIGTRTSKVLLLLLLGLIGLKVKSINIFIFICQKKNIINHKNNFFS